MYLKRPYFGSRRIAVEFNVNRKRVQRLMRAMGLEAIYPKPRTTVRCQQHRIYPYLLRDVEDALDRFGDGRCFGVVLRGGENLVAGLEGLDGLGGAVGHQDGRASGEADAHVEGRAEAAFRHEVS
jgi:hypothetical protein